MNVQPGERRKAFPAVGAVEGLLARVDPEVSLHAVFGPEALAAVGAEKGLLLRVGSEVGLEGPQSSEALLTLVTLMRSVHKMASLVDPHEGQACKRLLTVTALVPLALAPLWDRMGLLVFDEFGLRGEYLAADRADELGYAVHLPVCVALLRRAEHTLALGAGEAAAGRVSLLVIGQAGEEAEAFAAQAALVQRLGPVGLVVSGQFQLGPKARPTLKTGVGLVGEAVAVLLAERRKPLPALCAVQGGVDTHRALVVVQAPGRWEVNTTLGAFVAAASRVCGQVTQHLGTVDETLPTRRALVGNTPGIVGYARRVRPGRRGLPCGAVCVTLHPNTFYRLIRRLRDDAPR